MNSQLDQLRAAVLQKYGITSASPADCMGISNEIQKKFRKKISATTLKRFFGFAFVNFKFSRYTLQVLAEYADYHVDGTVIKESDSRAWLELHLKANEITRATLTAIQKRSALPYEHTISRNFATNDLKQFHESKFKFMAFVGNPGSGKTTLLSHLVTDLFKDPKAPWSNDVVVFIQAFDLLRGTTTLVTLDSLLKKVLQLNEGIDLIAYLDHHHRLSKSKFVLVLDGFEEVNLNKDIKNELLNVILDFICGLGKTTQIKVVLGLRPAKWSRLQLRMNRSVLLRESFFPGNYFDSSVCINVPLLEGGELLQIMKKVNITSHAHHLISLKYELAIPSNLHLYAQIMRSCDPSDFYTDIVRYEIIHGLITEKLDQSNYYTEKLMILRQFIKLSGYGKSSTPVVKAHLISGFSKFKNAYNELIVCGILIEEPTDGDFPNLEHVRFASTAVYDYFLFLSLCDGFGGRNGVGLITYINLSYQGYPFRLSLLQWAIRQIIQAEFHMNFNELKELEHRDEQDLLTFFYLENLILTRDNLSGSRAALQNQELARELLNGFFFRRFGNPSLRSVIFVFAAECTGQGYSINFQLMLAIDSLQRFDKVHLIHAVKLLKMQSSKLTGYMRHVLNYLDQLIYIFDGFDKPAVDIKTYDQIYSDFIEAEDSFPLMNRNYMLVGMLLSIGFRLKGRILDSHRINLALFLHYEYFFKQNLSFMPWLIGGQINYDKLKESSVSYSNSCHELFFSSCSESMVLLMDGDVNRAAGNYEAAIAQTLSALKGLKKEQLLLSCLLVYDQLLRIYREVNDSVKLKYYQSEKDSFMSYIAIRKHL